MGRSARYGPRRSPYQARAERHSSEVSRRLGRTLKDLRERADLTQRQAATRAGLSQSGWSRLESGDDARVTLATWDRAATAVGGSLEAFIRGGSAADQPRDAAHLRNQELIIRTAAAGGWRALPEEAIDREARTSRAADSMPSIAMPLRECATTDPFPG